MNPHSGSNFDDFLQEEGILTSVSANAHKRLLALQLADIMQKRQMTKTSLAEKLNTSRSQLDRLLDPNNTAINLESLTRVAQAVDKQLQIRFV